MRYFLCKILKADDTLISIDLRRFTVSSADEFIGITNGESYNSELLDIFHLTDIKSITFELLEE